MSENNIRIEVPAVVDGEIIPIEEVEDQIFSQKLIGDGYGIHPTSQVVYSPIDGRVEQVAESGHAVYLSISDEIKLLIHIGIDTIDLKGEGFESQLKKGMAVKRGDPLIKFDPKFIKEEGLNPVICVVLLNGTPKMFELEVHPLKEAVANETIAMLIDSVQ